MGPVVGTPPDQAAPPHQRDVLMLKHLRSAARLLDAVRLSDQERRQLAALIRGSQERVEARLRGRLRPQITAALDEVGLVARNLPERVARKKACRGVARPGWRARLLDDG